ncbi:hypothetical protein ACFYKX_02430 [Cytobacillus sp. FJAT-54145]|uniref:Sporulation protein YjcZ n=1 Tax=Cytobacillus spartinae TaxID=3299023 RepID=A0ABW6K5L3_9BACI
MNYYRMCCDGIGRPVRIRTHDGRMHVGIIDRVTPSRVFLRPMGGARRNYGGAGYNGAAYPYGGWGLGWGFAAGIAIGAIVSLAFFWW